METFDFVKQDRISSTQNLLIISVRVNRSFKIEEMECKQFSMLLLDLLEGYCFIRYSVLISGK